MKKNIKIALTFILFIFFSAIYWNCSSSADTSQDDNNSGTNFVTGKILMVENEPFAKLAILTENSLYLLDYPDDVKDTLYKIQGLTAKVFYSSISRNEQSVKVIKVEKVEILNSSSD